MLHIDIFKDVIYYTNTPLAVIFTSNASTSTNNICSFLYNKSILLLCLRMSLVFIVAWPVTSENQASKSVVDS